MLQLNNVYFQNINLKYSSITINSLFKNSSAVQVTKHFII